MGYFTAFVVAPQYEGLGYASIMRMHMEAFMANTTNAPQGVYFLDTVTATTERTRAAAHGLMQKVGAIRSQHSPESYMKPVFPTTSNPPEILTVNNIQLKRRGAENNQITPPDGVTYRKRTFWVGETPIATIKHGTLQFTCEAIAWEERVLLWHAARAAGFSTGISL